MKNFWSALPRPFFVQAPMDDVTDAAFRRMFARYGKPDVMYTEFTSADGLVLAPEGGQRALRKKLLFGEGERPIVAQLFTSVPEHMEAAAHIAADLGFDGIDINMGCPDRAVEKGGCGADLIRHPQLARELIRAAQKSGLPVSVKTRIGYNADKLDAWLPELLAENPAAVTIHARTRKELSDVPARWDRVARAVELRDSLQNPKGVASGIMTLIVGNGDVCDMKDARAKAAETKCDGVMFGRAIFGNPWLFAERIEPPSPKERMQALSEHLALFDELLSDTTNYATMKKHFKAYISGWSGAKELRIKLMETDSAAQSRAILESDILSA
jgi:nifR3 family TIM-barrel protein